MGSVNRERSLDSIIVYFSAALVITAGVGACLLRGFFTEEMYLFLTLWFVMCSAALLYLYIGVGKWRSSAGEQVEYVEL